MNASGIPKGMKMPEWSTQLSLDSMARSGVGVSILSISAPAVGFSKDKAEAASLARENNEYAASLRDQSPSQFGFFATLPNLDDVKACMDEIAHSFDVLKAEGVTLLTSYSGKYLGHPDFRPIWDELDRRGSVVFIHPSADIHAGVLKEPWIPAPIIDFPHETTRTAVHMIIANTVREHPNCKIILSHGGGTLPYAATRFAYLSAEGNFMQKSAEEFVEDAKSFYYDLALTAFDHPVRLLREFARKDHILYGSDFPFAREGILAQQVANLDQIFSGMSREEEFSIRRGAALKLFPRLAKS